MTPEQAIKKARAGEILPVYLVLGEESLIVERVARELREIVLRDAPAAFNEDKFVAGETDIDTVINAARMVPMMAERRLVIVRHVERWEGRGQGSEGQATPTKRAASPLDRLADYARAPSPTTSLVLVATKLDPRRRFALLAKKEDFNIICEPLARGALPRWIAREAKARGHLISNELAQVLAQIAGPDLASVSDALERTMLYVGEGAEITEDAISVSVMRVRQSTIWELIDAIGRRDLPKALAAVADVHEPGDSALGLLTLIARSVRQLLKFESAIRAGSSPQEAVKIAGAPPFKARDLSAQIRTISRFELERWLTVLAETDLALKGSRRAPLSVIETTIIDLCATPRGPSRSPRSPGSR